MDSVDNLEKYNPPPLMCLAEEQRGGMGADDRVCIGMITICPSSGDIVWDEFEGETISNLLLSSPQ
jgi:DNA mismatch repair protein MSH3